MRLLLENLPASLNTHREDVRQCLLAFESTMPIERVILFGSHARGEARPGSDVDFCVVSTGATKQSEAARLLRIAAWRVWPKQAMTVVPIAPARLLEKKMGGDHFYTTLLREGVPLASEN